MKKVFISYAHDDTTKEIVEALSNYLTKNGMRVSYDKNSDLISPLSGWRVWMQNEIEKSDLVLIICTKKYFDFFNKDSQESDGGYGVTWEATIITNELYKNKCLNNKFYPIMLDRMSYEFVPAILSPWINDYIFPENKTKILDLCKQIDAQLLPATVKIIEPVVFKDTFKDWLEDTGIKLTHRIKRKVILDDVYIEPELDFFETTSSNIQFRDCSKIIFKSGKFLIKADEQCGKSSLLKYAFSNYLKLSNIPVYIDAKKIRSSNIEKIINEQLEKQFENFENFEVSVVLIDDIDSIGLNEDALNKVLEYLESKYETIIITCNHNIDLDPNKFLKLNDYDHFNLTLFGHKKRNKLIRKWLSLGKEDVITNAELNRLSDEIQNNLLTFIRRNVVPAKPLYILMFLQIIEAGTEHQTELTSYGYCYQKLIYKSLDDAGINSKDYYLYLNVLSEISWWILVNDKNLNKNDMDNFFNDYSRNYLLNDKDLVLQKLKDSSIINFDEIEYSFKYSYFYYYFAAYRISTHLKDKLVQDKFEELVSNIHFEVYANILIFITHHSKDNILIEKICNELDTLFSETEEATLKKESLVFMEQFVKKIPHLVDVQTKLSEEERDSELDLIDLHERERDQNDKLDPDLLSSLNKTFKGIEIAGQIIRNRHASLQISEMNSLAESGINSGLRLLTFFIDFSETTKDYILKLILEHISEGEYLSSRDLEKFAEDAYLRLTYGVINAVLIKIGSSIGSKEAFSIYSNLEKVNGKTPAMCLIKTFISLHYKKRIDFNEISDAYNYLYNNAVCSRILKEMVIRNARLYPLDYKENQRLSSLLKIKIKDQNTIDSQGKFLM